MPRAKAAALARCTLPLLCLAPTLAWAQPAAPVPDETCKALAAAYAAAIDSAAPVWPADIRPSSRVLALGKFVPRYKQRMALEPGEFEDLLSREGAHTVPGYRPYCLAPVTPSRKLDDEGHRQFISFTSPIFSTDRRLALIQVSFQEDAGFGYGVMCIARRSPAATWSARCLPSWIN